MKCHEKICLIDGDIILYNVAWGSEKETFEWNVKYNIYYTLLSILTKNNTTDYIGFITGLNNFRKQIELPRKYKANRKKEKPKWFNFVKKIMIEELKFIETNTIETDDALAICSNNLKNTIICTTDKDLFQIPGEHYNFITDKTIIISKEEAEKFFWMQMLTGDFTDNIEGIKGLGPVKAKKILNDVTDYKSKVLNVYIDNYGEYKGIEYFYKNYVLLKLLVEYENFTIPDVNKIDIKKPIEYYIGVPKLKMFKSNELYANEN
ncbi:MAG: hypothetical protein QXL18_01755 [Candidatus Woesearchaeota archaeon]